jgi:hypothetical protein
MNSTLKRFIVRGTEDLPDHPEVCLSNIRGIVEQALDLIWKAELGPGNKVPSEWFDTWKRLGARNFDDWLEQFPPSRGQQLRLLQLMTGAMPRIPKCAKYVTKNTYALANAAHGFGDFGQHTDGVAVDLGVAYAALTVCIELAANLTRELSRTP